MKKLTLLIIPILLICLTGCREKTGQMVCTLETKDVVNGYELHSEYKINYKDNKVESVKTIEIITSESEDILNYFETTLKDTYSKSNKAYSGYTYNINKDDNKVTSEVTIDYNTMNLKQFVNDQPSLKSYVKDDKLLIDGIKLIYESIGATCK